MSIMSAPAEPAEVAGHDISHETIGKALRARRTELGLSIADLAERSGLSASFIATVERGRSDISLGRLGRLTNALEVPLVELLSPTPRGNPVVVRREDRHRIGVEGDTVHRMLLAPSLAGKYQHLISVYQPRASSGRDYPASKDVEVFVYVLEGEVLFEFEHADAVVLRTGDSCSYSLDRNRRVVNLSDEESFVLTFASPSITHEQDSPRA